MNHFADGLFRKVNEKKSIVIVGIDPRFDLLPSSLKRGARGRAGRAKAFLRFGKGIIDASARHAVGVKVQVAFYEALGPEGMVAFAATLAYARRRRMVTIADVKRGDIGSTAEAYAEAYLSSRSGFEADAVTLNPLLGTDSVEPFVRAAAEHGRGLFFLVKTSNPSSADFQNLAVARDTGAACGGSRGGGCGAIDSVAAREGQEPMYMAIARKVAAWGAPHVGKSGYSLVGSVVGATHPREASAIRGIAPRSVFLVPGYGAQGGGIEGVRACLNPDGKGAVVAAARSVIFAWHTEPWKSKFGERRWQRAIESAAEQMKLELAVLCVGEIG
ncbi:MAG: orotidine-5'-phosphate decarboxylase [Planctomycetota bacterium]|nr:orotidine-5'-phosphate decarboxylase [Planctomycetota bacterium]